MHFNAFSILDLHHASGSDMPLILWKHFQGDTVLILGLVICNQVICIQTCLSFGVNSIGV